jgi:hypothetical protein
LYRGISDFKKGYSLELNSKGWEGWFGCSIPEYNG